MTGFPAGGGRMGALMRAHDWAASPLGPAARWPVALRTLVDVMLGSQQAMFVAWGAEHTMLYNEGYAAILGAKHPQSLGSPFFKVWAEIAEDLRPLVARVRAGESVHMNDIALMVDRGGVREETHFSFSYTPLHDAETGVRELGEVAGFFCPCADITAQVMAERRLRASDAEARDVLEGMGEGFILLDREFRIRRISAESLRIEGRPREAIVGSHLLEAWPEAEHHPTWPFYQRLMSERASDQLVYRHRSDRHDVWLDVRAYPTQDGLAVFYRDVTADKRAEQALRDSEAQFRALAQAMPNHAWTARGDGDLDWFNDQALAYTGAASSALAGQNWVRAVHPDDVDHAGAVWRRSLATGEPYEVEFRIRRADGAYRWHLVRAEPIRTPDGDVVQWIGTNTDIEAQRVASRALADLNVDLERRVAERTAERDRVWRNSQDLLLVVDLEGVFRAVNPAWNAVLGLRPEDAIGRSYQEFVWPDDLDLTRRTHDTLAGKQELTSFENRFRHADGTPRWISWHTSVEGDLVYAYGRDVTADKQQAEALSQAEAALRQSQKMEAVGQLTGGLAHDFNNLLTGITGCLELLQTRVAQGRLAEVDRYVDAAQGAAKRAAALTHRLLAFSRQQTLDPRAVEINRLIAGMEDLVRRTVGPAIAVEVVGAAGVWTTLVDPNQLENALLNLCINARDAMPDGGRLTIETGNKWLDDRAARERELPAGQYVSLCVSDNGVGMTPEVARRAFDPFFTTKSIGLGTGLGLSMIYGFARQSGGQARIYSEPGQGAMVCLYLPRHLGQAAPIEHISTAADPPRAAQGETVLVVDDEPTVRMLVTEVLEGMGYTALEAADGPAGLEVLRSQARIDLLITDVGLPGGLNGRQVAEAARAARPGLKALFITGYAENAAFSHGHLEPGTHMLTKPFAMATLASKIKDIIAGP